MTPMIVKVWLVVVLLICTPLFLAFLNVFLVFCVVLTCVEILTEQSHGDLRK